MRRNQVVKGMGCFQLKVLLKEGAREDYGVCWENGGTAHVMGEKPRVVPWGLKEAKPSL